MADSCARSIPVLLSWLFLSAAIGASGLLSRLPAPAVPALLLVLTLCTLLMYFRSRPFGNCVKSIALPVLVLFHLTRFVGFYFLLLYEAGRLPYEFAVLGGWGDIAVAATAGLAALSGSPRVLWIWNAFGLADILFVVTTAVRLNFQRPGSMAELAHLPLSFLPTFLVPLIIASHVVIFDRLRREWNADLSQTFCATNRPAQD
jgi:hypothetical protein